MGLELFAQFSFRNNWRCFAIFASDVVLFDQDRSSVMFGDAHSLYWCAADDDGFC